MTPTNTPRDVTLPDMIASVQNHTGFPWFNGEAYAEYKGYPQTIRRNEIAIADAVSDLYEVVEWLRTEKLYAQSDRIRAIAQRLNKPPFLLTMDQVRAMRAASGAKPHVFRKWSMTWALSLAATAMGYSVTPLDAPGVMGGKGAKEHGE